jgi:hypothetical protein
LNNIISKQLKNIKKIIQNKKKIKILWDLSCTASQNIHLEFTGRKALPTRQNGTLRSDSKTGKYSLFVGFQKPWRESMLLLPPRRCYERVPWLPCFAFPITQTTHRAIFVGIFALNSAAQIRFLSYYSWYNPSISSHIQITSSFRVLLLHALFVQPSFVFIPSNRVDT